MSVGDEILSIDGQEINMHTLAILTLKGAAMGHDNPTPETVVRDLLSGPRGSLVTLILKRTGRQADRASEVAAPPTGAQPPAPARPLSKGVSQPPPLAPEGPPAGGAPAATPRKKRGPSRPKGAGRRWWFW